MAKKANKVREKKRTNRPAPSHKLKHPEDKNPYRFVWVSILLLFIAAFILVSEISYFYNWKTDASIVSQPLGEVSADSVHNCCGHIGAKCADYLIRELFGFAAVIIPITIILYALYLVHLPGKWFRSKICPSVIILCFISLFLGGFFGRNDAYFGSGPGGEMGIYVAEWIKMYIGEEGTSILLLVSLALLLWILFTKQVIWLGRTILKGISLLTNRIHSKKETFDSTFDSTFETAIEQNSELNSESSLEESETEKSAIKEIANIEIGDENSGMTEGKTNISESEIPKFENLQSDPNRPIIEPIEPTIIPIVQPSSKFEPETSILDKHEPLLETICLDNGQLAAVVTEDFMLYLDLDALKQMDKDGMLKHEQDCKDDEECKEDDEEMFVIIHKTEETVDDDEPITKKETETETETEIEAEAESKEDTVTKSTDTELYYANKKGDIEEKYSTDTENDVENEIEISDNPFTSTKVDDMIISKSDSERKVSDEDVNERTLYDPTYELKNYCKPTIDLLKKYDEGDVIVKDEEVIKNKNQIVETLGTFGIKISEIEATVGPTVTLYEIKPAPGVRISKIQNLEKDIALALAALGIRIIAPIPGKGAIGIEVPNRNKATVSMYSVIKSARFHDSKAELPIALGKTIQNETLVLDLAKMPHLLVAGATGQGKSVGLNAIITSLLYKKHPAELKFVMVDPKRLELTPYAALAKHFMAQMEGSDSIILTDTEKVVFTLNSICKEMDDRYRLLEDAGVKNLKEYNDKFIHRKLNPEKGHRFLPYLVVIVDEFADLIMTAGREIETPIARIAQLARAAGIHMIIATQRPTTNIITGTIKANFPARIAFRVTSYIDSKTILDRAGAEQLIGRGDMLVQSGSDLIRVQCAFVDTPEVEAITQYIGVQHGYFEPYQLPEYQPESESKDVAQVSGPMQVDPLLIEVARYVVDNQIGSTSKIQRNFEIGFNRAGRIVDQLESLGIVGKQSGSKPRQVLITDPVYLEQILDTIR